MPAQRATHPLRSAYYGAQVQTRGSSVEKSFRMPRKLVVAAFLLSLGVPAFAQRTTGDIIGLSVFADALNLKSEDANQAVQSTNVTSDVYQYPAFFAGPRRFMLGAKASF